MNKFRKIRTYVKISKIKNYTSGNPDFEEIEFEESIKGLPKTKTKKEKAHKYSVTKRNTNHIQSGNPKQEMEDIFLLYYDLPYQGPHGPEFLESVISHGGAQTVPGHRNFSKTPHHSTKPLYHF